MAQTVSMPILLRYSLITIDGHLSRTYAKINTPYLTTVAEPLDLAAMV